MDLLPCPMCGSSSPFTHITFSCAVLRCNCGVSLDGASVRTMYKREDVPLALERHTYEPILLVMRNKDGVETPYPDHGYVGVNAIEAFNLYGHLARWNRRVSKKGTPC
jgi:hypothetical protein